MWTPRVRTLAGTVGGGSDNGTVDPRLDVVHRPLVEGGRGIAGFLLRRRAAQAEIGEIGGQILEGADFRVVDPGDGDAAAAQQFDEFGAMKARVAHLDDVADGAAAELLRQQRQEAAEILGVELRRRGELPEDWPQLVAEFEKTALEKPRHIRLGRGQLAAMRQKPRPFQREDEILGRLVMPFLEAGRRLSAVEGAVDLDRGDVAAGIGEFIGLAQSLRVERAAPRREDPAADADAYAAASRQRPSTPQG